MISALPFATGLALSVLGLVCLGAALGALPRGDQPALDAVRRGRALLATALGLFAASVVIRAGAALLAL